MSERIKPRPTGGSNASCGSLAMLPTGPLGKTALLANVTPNSKSVIRTEKRRG
jgi:hypothetical protein